jgi:hypothetical protein
MMMKDPKTGEFYDVDLRDPRQSEEAAKKGLVYACTHYFPPGEVGGECPGGVGDIMEFWRLK